MKGMIASEVDSIVRRGYITRLSDRVKLMRKLFYERNWDGLKAEFERIHSSAGDFGLSEIQQLAREAKDSIPPLATARSHVRPVSKKTIELLFTAIDETVITEEI